MITFVRFLIKDTPGVCGEWLSPMLRLRHLCQAKPKSLRLYGVSIVCGFIPGSAEALVISRVH